MQDKKLLNNFHLNKLIYDYYKLSSHLTPQNINHHKIGKYFAKYGHVDWAIVETRKDRVSR